MPEAPDAITLDDPSGRVTFEDVRFSYRTGDEVLHGIDLDVAPGESVAIVGATGAGKSSLVNLAPRFYDATAGVVRIDGVDVRTLTLPSLRGSFGIVLQDPFLFAGTLADNIRYGNPEATDERVRDAARTAGSLDFIEGLEKGFLTEVGERGVSLSTGQRQLVAFARAIVGEPAILIMDEATSSVDSRTEQLIQQGLRRILKGRTSLIIAHRLSTIRDADRIVVLEDGRIAEQGTYRELLSSGGLFADLHAAQFSE